MAVKTQTLIYIHLYLGDLKEITVIFGLPSPYFCIFIVNIKSKKFLPGSQEKYFNLKNKLIETRK